MIRKSDAIRSLCPNAEFTVRGSGLDGVVEWVNPSVAPVTEEQIRAEYERLLAEAPKMEIRSDRQRAYQSEADPLFFKAQRGEATMAEWSSKVDEIRARFPYAD